MTAATSSEASGEAEGARVSGAPDLGELRAALSAAPDDAVLTDPDRMAGYRWDRANDPGAGVPLAVVRASSTEDVQATLRFADRHRVPVVARGAGTGLSGGSSAVDGCIVVSTERMRRIEVDPATRTCTVEPGLLNVEVKAAVAEHGLWYPPDPSSFEICSIGGNIATNAGGLCCVKYGVTTDYVLGLTVVLADGTAVELGGPRLKDAAGLSLTKLFVGSEGTLGIVTRIVLRLLPATHAPATLVATFPTLGGATDAVVGITRSLRPSMLELMDRHTVNAVEDHTRMGLDRSAAALLVVQSDESPAVAAQELARVAEVCRDAGATEVVATDDPADGEAFVAARRMAIPAVERRGPLLLEDVGVPLPALGALVQGIADVAERNDVDIAVVAHAGDGNTHPLIVCDPTDPAHLARAQTAYGEVMELAIGLGGTITGEHGVGRLKKPWLPSYLGEDAMRLNQRVKDALDPHGILNPGAVF
ncbi:FAD-linked oxidase C-terminal domain-containing protein [Nocardioides sp. TF02-7]|uniref:FAD-binding oxidoreductase n=1 Tax=Nocardioides sp. TF02-7 TaxID=2917724 RepID=UPI001F06C9EC|nr:FAD-linked oxidase C-terminal domain-containing protein [Nocardioides sp. TF02-7]UMG92827.1 FAD-binding protein [Nocardioides sp. TF02-7]